ncbi:MAG: hypothetical protein FWD52_06565 [Candidatus Bathyarchaeota archaeon]|nr:hypothetical protein [Candidatus Termiticorpusculum sp.]
MHRHTQEQVADALREPVKRSELFNAGSIAVAIIVADAVVSAVGLFAHDIPHVFLIATIGYGLHYSVHRIFDSIKDKQEERTIKKLNKRVSSLIEDPHGKDLLEKHIQKVNTDEDKHKHKEEHTFLKSIFKILTSLSYEVECKLENLEKLPAKKHIKRKHITLIIRKNPGKNTQGIGYKIKKLIGIDGGRKLVITYRNTSSETILKELRQLKEVTDKLLELQPTLEPLNSNTQKNTTHP